MPLTPEDVRNKRFTPVRLREGYDMGEVDQFLDEVESELQRLAATGNGSDSEPVTTETAEHAAARTTDAAKPTSEPVVAGADNAEPHTVSAASVAAARLMELAGRNADQVVAEAEASAESIVSEARAQAQRLEQESTSKVETMQTEARERSERVETEVGTRRRELMAELETERDAVGAEVEHLRAFEREYRSRLKLYFSSQLAQLEGEETASTALSDTDDGESRRDETAVGRSADPDAADTDNSEADPAGDGQQPRSRLQSLLGEEPDQHS